MERQTKILRNPCTKLLAFINANTCTKPFAFISANTCTKPLAFINADINTGLPEDLFYHLSTFFMAFDDITFIRNMAANAINITMTTHTPAVR